LFLLLVEFFLGVFLYTQQQKFKLKEAAADNYTLFEIRIPRELEKSARSMENVFQVIHGLGNAPSGWKETYIEGQVPLWFSAELVSIGGEIHFFLRVLKKHKNLVEVAFFSQYPDVEIAEVKDYVRNLPATTSELYALGMDIWGAEIILSKDHAYPIKTYSMFESAEQTDPISAFLEVLAKLKAGEMVSLQIMISPAARDWSKKHMDMFAKLREPEMVDTGGETKTPLSATVKKSEIINAVENKLNKPAFNTLLRLCYMSPGSIAKEGSGFAKGGIMGALSQFGSPNLNSFKANSGTATKIGKWEFPYTYVDKRVEFRKQRLLYNFRQRENPPDTFLGRLFSSFRYDWNFESTSYELTTEELATIFHPATTAVLTAPHMKRVESKKAGPAAGLDIFGEDEDIEKFKGAK
jgi:hypothetical protein